MEECRAVRQKIITVDEGSPADKNGVRAGEILLYINGEPVVDLIDYEALSTEEKLVLTIEDGLGDARRVAVHKDPYEPLGLNFSTTLMSGMRTCANRCRFCFVDQMPKGMRSSLSVKDDDWRMSFIMGNYVTLTNIPDAEFERLIRRKVGPLYISVHATDPAVRTDLMQNRNAGKILERLQRLCETGIRFHCQIVLCPGINDGKILEKSLRDLASMHPYASTCAVVPVGLTKYREGLYPLKAYTKETARPVMETVHAFQNECLEKFGQRFVFLSDEWYLMTDNELPAYEAYEDFDQIENGVGLLRLFEADFLYALEDKKPLKKERRVSIAGGSGCAGFFEKLYSVLDGYNVKVKLYPVPNRFFGGNVNVAGLVTGQDMIDALQGRLDTEELLIPKNMLREHDNVFLDDITVEELENILKVKIIPFTGETAADAVFGDLRK